MHCASVLFIVWFPMKSKEGLVIGDGQDVCSHNSTCAGNSFPNVDVSSIVKFVLPLVINSVSKFKTLHLEASTRGIKFNLEDQVLKGLRIIKSYSLICANLFK